MAMDPCTCTPPFLPTLAPTGTLEEAVYKRQIYKQQQSNMIIDDVEEARYWEGVQVRGAAPRAHKSGAAVMRRRAACSCCCRGPLGAVCRTPTSNTLLSTRQHTRTCTHPG
jgi:hypothetical protein